VDAAVAAAVISSGAALLIAVGGLIVNGKSQARAAKDAHGNVLDLFDRQEQARRRDVHIDHKRNRHLSLARVVSEYKRAAVRVERAMKQVTDTADDDHEAWLKAVKEVNKVSRAYQSIHDALTDASENLRLLAPTTVTVAAARWVEAVTEGCSASGADPAPRVLQGRDG
jgi:hypothetical protein